MKNMKTTTTDLTTKTKNRYNGFDTKMKTTTINLTPKNGTTKMKNMTTTTTTKTTINPPHNGGGERSVTMTSTYTTYFEAVLSDPQVVSTRTSYEVAMTERAAARLDISVWGETPTRTARVDLAEANINHYYQVWQSATADAETRWTELNR